MTPTNKKWDDSTIKKFEEAYNAKYVMDSALDDYTRCMLFYCNEAHEVSKSNYFAVYVDSVRNSPMITNGQSLVKEYTGVLNTKTNELYHSTTRHDLYNYDGGFVDGGQAYFRWGCTNELEHIKQVKFTPVGNELVVI